MHFFIPLDGFVDCTTHMNDVKDINCIDIKVTNKMGEDFSVHLGFNYEDPSQTELCVDYGWSIWDGGYTCLSSLGFNDCQISYDKHGHSVTLTLINDSNRFLLHYHPTSPSDFGREQILYDAFEQFRRCIKAVNELYS